MQAFVPGVWAKETMKKLFVLQRQPIGEHQFLLDIFSAEQGRLSVVTPKRSSKQNFYIPDCFQQCQADWRPGEDWPNIKVLQLQQSYELADSALYCGLYLNELLVRLLSRHEPLPLLFQVYRSVLMGLEQGGAAEPWLRLFEHQLLQQLGYGVCWQYDSLQRPIDRKLSYRFNAQDGFVLHGAGQYSGADIHAFNVWLQNFSQLPGSVSVWQMAKQVLRLSLENILERPLVSRELFSATTI